MTTARPMACSNELESATDASTAPQSMAFRHERPLPTADALFATTCSTNLRTRSNDPMLKGSMAEADPPGSASSDWKEESGVVAEGQFCGAPASVEEIVRVRKALFTIFGACRATRTASVWWSRSGAFGHARGRIDFGHPWFVRWSHHGVQSVQFL